MKATAAFSLVIALALATTACTASKNGKPQCAGTVLTVPKGADGKGFTIAQLMAHASAMGMSQKDAETLIYLEGINPQATLKPGETICLDGRPDAAK
ncbi:MAG: hypothetical protein ABGW87_12485 [Sphingomonadaceae bacterium]